MLTTKMNTIWGSFHMLSKLFWMRFIDQGLRLLKCIYQNFCWEIPLFLQDYTANYLNHVHINQRCPGDPAIYNPNLSITYPSNLVSQAGQLYKVRGTVLKYKVDCSVNQGIYHYILPINYANALRFAVHCWGSVSILFTQIFYFTDTG